MSSGRAAMTSLRGGFAAGILAAGLAGAACGAPASRPAEGKVADAVRASLVGGTATFDHADWSALLAAGSREGLVDYAAFRVRRAALDAYLGRVATADLARLAPAHLEALLINAYNALTIRTILDHPGVASIRDIDGAWSRTTHTVGGYPLTLDAIEHNLLRPFWRDPRVHFALNCASRSCAPLPRWAYEGDTLAAQLEERTRAFLTDPRQVRVEGGKLALSRYFEWYGTDFTADGWSPRAETAALFVALYTEGTVAEFIHAAHGDPPVIFLDYDWALNEAGQPQP